MIGRCWLCRWLPCSPTREERAHVVELVAEARGATMETWDAARRAAAAQISHQDRSDTLASRVARLRAVNEVKARRVKGTMDALLNRMRNDE